jgi:PilZ domain-containing protein
MLPTSAEYDCHVVDISQVGIALNCAAKPQFGDKIIVYLNDLGRFEGVVVRFISEGFAVETQLPPLQRQRLVERIDWLLQENQENRRKSVRRTPTSNELTEYKHIIIKDGIEVPFNVLDISTTGAHLQIRNRPSIGTPVTLGRNLGRVVRHTDEGVGIEFLNATKSDK